MLDIGILFAALLALPWWLLVGLVVGFFLILFCAEKEQPEVCGGVILAALIALHFTKTVDFSQAPHHIKDIGINLGIYILIGLIWAAFRWKFYVMNWARNLKIVVEDARKDFLKKPLFVNGDVTDVDEFTTVWTNVDSGGYSLPHVHAKNRRPLTQAETDKLWAGKKAKLIDLDTIHVGKNKRRLVTWGLYWPASFIYTMFSDPLRWLYEWILVDVMGKTLSKMSQKALEDVNSVG